jgi:hypothetical protein
MLFGVICDIKRKYRIYDDTEQASDASGVLKKGPMLDGTSDPFTTQ